MGRLNEVVLTGIVDEENRRLVKVSANGLQANVPLLSQDGKSLVGVDGKNWHDRVTLDRPLRIATFGDSTAESWQTVGLVGWSKKTDTNTFTGAGYAASGAIVLASRAAHLSGYVPALYVGDGGNSGYTTAAMLELSGDDYSDTRGAITDVLATHPDLIEYNGASINNFWSYSENANGISDSVLNTWADEHVQIVKLLTSTGIPVISLGVLGYSPSQTPEILARQRDAVVRYNNLLAAKHAASGNDLSHFINPEGITAINGAFMPDVSTVDNDGTHLTDTGNGPLRLGAQKAEIVTGLFKPSIAFTKSMVFDDLADFANPSDGLPSGYQIGSLVDCTVTSKACTYDKCVVDFTVGVDGGGLAIEKIGSAFLGKHLVAGKTYYISGRLDVVSDNIVSGVFDAVMQAVRTSDTSTQLQYRSSFAIKRSNLLNLHCTSPSNGGDLMNWSIVARKISGLKAGAYRIEFTPIYMSEVL